MDCGFARPGPPSAFGMLCDEGLKVVAELIVAIEAVGMFPDQIWFLLLPLLSKPKGGYRTILVQAGLVRLLERLWRRELEDFFDEVDRGYWAFGAGMSAEGLAWLNAAEAEFTAGLKQFTGGFLWDA